MKKMEKLILKDEFIKLGQALKAAGLVSSGSEAKDVILNGLVKVNGKAELQRGKKLYENDIVAYDDQQIIIIKQQVPV